MEYNSNAPIYMQVMRELKKLMIKGELKPGQKMPSNRDLAVLFKVNQNTAARVYREMENEGCCYTRRGIGTFVSEEEEMFENLKSEMAEELLRNFMKEMKDLGFQKDVERETAARTGAAGQEKGLGEVTGPRFWTLCPEPPPFP